MKTIDETLLEKYPDGMVCVFHKVDLDGWFSGALVHRYCSHNNIPVKMIGWTYGEVVPDFLYETDNKMIVVLADICFPMAQMMLLNSRENLHLIWIDHHISQIMEHEKMMVNGHAKIDGLRMTEYAACELVVKYFDLLNKRIIGYGQDNLIKYLGLYDSFRHKSLDQAESDKVWNIQLYMRSQVNTWKQAADFLGFNQSPSFDMMDDAGSIINEYLCKDAVSIWSDRHEVLFEGYRCAVFNRNRFNPANFQIDYHKLGIDMIITFHYDNGQWSLSLYNENGNVDCSVIAKKYGGGGHRGAAGMRLSTAQMQRLNIFQ